MTELDKLRRTIAIACREHSDSGESSFDMESRRILLKLKQAGYLIFHMDQEIKDGIIFSTADSLNDNPPPPVPKN